MSGIVSTAPAAVAVLQGHMQAVADANPDLGAGVYLGEIVGNVANNFLAIGNPTGDPGDIIAGYQATHVGVYRAGAGRLAESYAITCTLRTWAPQIDPIARLTDAFTLINALINRLADDPQGRGTGTTPALGSGSWSITNVVNEHAGRIEGQGWGCGFTFSVEVADVILTSH